MRAGLPWLVAAVILLAAPVARSAGTWPNDPAWGGEWGPVLTNTPQVWAKGTGSPSVVIAVVDTGVAPVPDLQGALVPGIDLVGGGVSQGGPDELGYHGTWVASIIAARGNNGRDAAGYCWQCSIMPVRVSDGESPANDGVVAQGIRWAVDHGARIVNVSLAGSGSNFDEQSAIAYAVAHNVLVVAAAGNSGDDTVHYPGGYPSVLAVAGTDQNDQLYSWSSRGSWVALAAPGCATVVDPNVGAAYGCGSSFAPAAVSGIAGLLLSFNPSLTADQIASALESSAHAVSGIGGGRVDAAAAFAALALPDVTNAPSPAQPEAAPAAAAAETPLEVTDLSGTVAGARAFPFSTGRGVVSVYFSTVRSARCQVTLNLGSSVAVALTQHGSATLGAVTRAGLKRLTVRCASSRRFAYQLEIEHPTATG
jgi:hypothetical protein